MSQLNDESIPEIVKDLDCVQETQQHSVVIEHNWAIGEIRELIQFKRPGEKIESEQFFYEPARNEKQTHNKKSKSNSSSTESSHFLTSNRSLDEDSSSVSSSSSSSSSDPSNICKYCIENCCQQSAKSHKQKATHGKLCRIPTSNSINFELACDFFLQNTQWRLELNKCLTDVNFLSLNVLLCANLTPTDDAQRLLNRVTQILDNLPDSLANTTNTRLILILKCYLFNDKMNDLYPERGKIEIRVDLYKYLKHFRLNLINNMKSSSCRRRQFALDKYSLDKYCRLSELLKWLNDRKSPDFCLLSEFKFYTEVETPHTFDTCLLDVSMSRSRKGAKLANPSSSSLTYSYKHAWMIKAWKNFLMSGDQLHTFMNDSDLLNLTNFDSVKLAKFRSKLFSMVDAGGCCDEDDVESTDNNKKQVNSVLNSVKWKLQLYPNGYSDEFENNLSLFVNFSSLNGQLAQFTTNRKHNSTMHQNLQTSIEEVLYDSNDTNGLILLIRSPTSSSSSSSSSDSAIDTDEPSNEAKQTARKFETFVKASFQISIVDSNGKKVDKCQSEKQLFELFGSWGYKEYMNVKDLVDHRDKYLTNDFTTLNLNCKIVLFYTLTVKTINNKPPILPQIETTKQPSTKPTTNPKPAVKSSKPKTPLSECNSLLYDLRRLFLNSNMYDLIVQAPYRVTLDTDDDEVTMKQFKVHKLILSIRSEVFEKMLGDNELNGNVKTLDIVDFDAFTVETFLNYLYTDRLEINLTSGELKRNLPPPAEDGLNESESENEHITKYVFVELFKLADKYQVHKLRQLCEYQLVRLISKLNCIELLVLGYLHNSSRLKKHCFNYLIENLNHMINQPAWLRLEKTYPALLAEAFRVLYYKQRKKV